MADAKQPAALTEYVVIREDHKLPDGGPSLWHIVQTVKASSAPSAIRSVVSRLTPETAQVGTFVAVPARSWRPTKVAPKTTVQLELTEVKP